MKKDNEVCIVGMGYVGLTLAIAMAKKDFIVHGVEIDDHKLALMKAGKSHFYETGIESALKSAIGTGHLTFSKDIPSRPYSVYMITAGTPIDKETKNPRFEIIERVSRQISEVMNENSLVILRSTVAVGTTRNKIIPILTQKVKAPQIAFCSERTLEGKALEELFALPQVIGAIDEASLERAMNIFHRITPTLLNVTSIETAEIIKLLDNVYRDTQFALGNEVAEICEVLGLNGKEVVRAANLGYERTKIALPGYVGGPCLEKDPYILAYSLKELVYEPKLIMRARTVNEKLEGRVADRILKWTSSHQLAPQKAKVVLLGLAFKGVPETDDVRGAPSVTMISELKNRGFIHISGHDPLVSEDSIKMLQIKSVDIMEAFDDANIAIFMNNNPSYKKIDPVDASRKMADPSLFFDSWNMFDPNSIPKDGKVSYGSIGCKIN